MANDVRYEKLGDYLHSVLGKMSGDALNRVVDVSVNGAVRREKESASLNKELSSFNEKPVVTAASYGDFITKLSQARLKVQEQEGKARARAEQIKNEKNGLRFGVDKLSNVAVLAKDVVVGRAEHDPNVSVDSSVRPALGVEPSDVQSALDFFNGIKRGPFSERIRKLAETEAVSHTVDVFTTAVNLDGKDIPVSREAAKVLGYLHQNPWRTGPDIRRDNNLTKPPSVYTSELEGKTYKGIFIRRGAPSGRFTELAVDPDGVVDLNIVSKEGMALLGVCVGRVVGGLGLQEDFPVEDANKLQEGVVFSGTNEQKKALINDTAEKIRRAAPNLEVRLSGEGYELARFIINHQGQLGPCVENHFETGMVWKEEQPAEVTGLKVLPVVVPSTPEAKRKHQDLLTANADIIGEAVRGVLRKMGKRKSLTGGQAASELGLLTHDLDPYRTVQKYTRNTRIGIEGLAFAAARKALQKETDINEKRLEKKVKEIVEGETVS